MTSVRVATSGDADRILSLHIESILAFGPAEYDERQVRAWARIDDREATYPVGEVGHHLVVAERDDEIAGYGHIIPDNEELRAVYVHPDHSRCGVGSTLLAHLEGYAHGRGLERLELWASLNAVPFYERQGYCGVGTETIEKEYEGETVSLPVCVMERRLGPGSDPSMAGE